MPQSPVKKLTDGVSIYSRSWTKKDGTTSHSYQLFIWQPKLKKRAKITLKSTNRKEAEKEAMMLFAKYGSKLEDGTSIQTKRKRVPCFVEEFVAFHSQRADRDQITHHRVRVLEHNLKSLVRLWEAERKLELDDFIPVYDAKFIEFRGKEERRGYRWVGDAKKRPITNRTMNTEIVVHKQFVNWCINRGYCVKRIECSEVKQEKANYPFPNDYYNKLLSVARKDIETSKHRYKWSKMNYYTIILLINRIGCRVAEVKNLEWKHIRKTKDGTRLFLYGKNKERDIIIPDRVAEYLERLRGFKRVEGKKWEWNEKDYPYLFSAWMSSRRNVHFDTDIRRSWMEEIGIENPEKWVYTTFRHKFITEALLAGVHSLTIAKYVGTSQNMIEKTYEGLIPKDIFNMVFKDAPEESLESKETLPKFLQ